MTPGEQMSQVRTVTLNQYAMQVNKILEEMPGIARNMQAQIREDEIIGTVLEMRSYILGVQGTKVLENVTVKTPAGWLEHLKMNHAPEWFKKRYPVKMITLKFPTETQNTYLCPHLPGDSFSRHVQFFYYGLNERLDK